MEHPKEFIQKQSEGLWLRGKEPIANETEAARFIKSVGVALRYNATSSLPLAAMYTTAGDTRRAVELTNALLASKEAVETNVIANRLVLIHRSLVPSVYTLRKRYRSTSLSPNAERTLALIQEDGTASAGDIRRFLGVNGLKRPDAADLALTELQREMRVDRGPSSVPKKGMAYLSPEGYPYRVFEKAHVDLVRESQKLSVESAVTIVLDAYLRAAYFATPRKLLSMFKLLFTESELNSISCSNIQKADKYLVWRKK